MRRENLEEKLEALRFNEAAARMEATAAFEALDQKPCDDFEEFEGLIRANVRPIDRFIDKAPYLGMTF